MLRAAILTLMALTGLAGCAGSHAAPGPSSSGCRARGAGLFMLPDSRCTPGAVNTNVTQSDIGSTICRLGYTHAIRPPESVTEPEKRASMAAYGDTGPASDYEYDHLIPLELGGSPNDRHNLWPEPGASPNPKDELEHRLNHMVCAGTIRLAAAQGAIAADWVALYRRIG